MKSKGLMISAGMFSVSWTLAGCAPTLSTIENNPSSNIVVHGMPYYLPIGKITLKGQFTAETHPAGDTDHASNPSTTESPPPKKSDGSSPNSSPIESPSKLTEKAEIASASPSPQKPTSGNSNTTTGNTTNDTNSVAIAAGGWTISLTAEVEADRNAPCYAIPRRNYVFDDEYHVTVNSKHLLTAGNTTAADRTADIVGSVASLASQAMKLAAVGPSPSRDSFYLSFHTNDFTEFQNAQTQLNQRDIYLELYPSPARASIGSKNVAKESFGQANTADGLAFRLAAPYKITLKYPSASGHAISYTHQFLLPTPEHAYVFDYARMPFAKKVLEIGFTNGMLTDYHETLPSPVLGFLGIPKSILAAIIPVPNGVNTAGTGTRASTSGGTN